MYPSRNGSCAVFILFIYLLNRHWWILFCPLKQELIGAWKYSALKDFKVIILNIKIMCLFNKLSLWDVGGRVSTVSGIILILACLRARIRKPEIIKLKLTQPDVVEDKCRGNRTRKEPETRTTSRHAQSSNQWKNEIRKLVWQHVYFPCVIIPGIVGVLNVTWPWTFG